MCETNDLNNLGLGVVSGGVSNAVVGVGNVPPCTNRGGFVTGGGVSVVALPCPERHDACFPHAPAGVTFAGLHGVTLSLTGADLVAVRDCVSDALLGLSLSPCSGLWTYQNRIRDGYTGTFVAWTDGRADMAVSITGKACEMLGVDGVLALTRRLIGLADSYRVTRLDCAWDTELFSVGDVVAAYTRGECVCRSRSYNYAQNRSGSTFYIGQRGDKNARLVRFYDRRGPTRCELELHGERATQLLAHISDEGADIATLCLGALVDFVDFRVLDADSNITRCPRADWWHAFVRDSEALPLPVPSRLPTLESVRDWLEDSVSGSLATIFDMLGEMRGRIWLGELVQRGRSRRSPRQAALLDITEKVKQNSIEMRKYAFFRH